jgi:hypothetical protein
MLINALTNVNVLLINGNLTLKGSDVVVFYQYITGKQLPVHNCAQLFKEQQTNHKNHDHE